MSQGMEAAFELTDADLHEVQRHRLVRGRRWGRRYHLPVVAAATVLATGIVWPFAKLLAPDLPALLMPLCGAFAGLFVLLLVRRGLGSGRGPAVHNVLRRMAERAVKSSTLGPVTIVLTTNSVKRLRAGAEALEVTGPGIRSLTVSQTVLVLHLSRAKVLVVPRRAFKDDAEALAFQQRVEQLAGKSAEPIAQGD